MFNTLRIQTSKSQNSVNLCHMLLPHGFATSLIVLLFIQNGPDVQNDRIKRSITFGFCGRKHVCFCIQVHTVEYTLNMFVCFSNILFVCMFCAHILVLLITVNHTSLFTGSDLPCKAGCWNPRESTASAEGHNHCQPYQRLSLSLSLTHTHTCTTHTHTHTHACVHTHTK